MSVMGVRVDLIVEDMIAVLSDIAQQLHRIADALEGEPDENDR